MMRRALRILVPMLTVILLGSCRKDKATDPVADLPLESPPVLPVPPGWGPVRFQNDSPTALDAQIKVATALNRARLTTRAEESFLASLNGIVWMRREGSCWVEVMEAGPMTEACRACPEGAGVSWEVVVNGSSGLPGDPQYRNWVKYRGTSSSDGASGSLVKTLPNTATTAKRWTWELGGIRGSGRWEFFGGSDQQATPFATLTRTVAQDGSEDATWLETAQAEWQMHLHGDGTTGAVRFSAWAQATSTWVLGEEVDWEAGHGAWKFFDPEGALIDSRSW